MNWYKTFQQVINEPPISYLDIGHWGGEDYSTKNLYLWRYKPGGQLDTLKYNPQLHTLATFKHGKLFSVDGYPFSGRCDMNRRICSIAGLEEIPDELIWKLMEKFGDDIRIFNYSRHPYRSPITAKTNGLCKFSQVIQTGTRGWYQMGGQKFPVVITKPETINVRGHPTTVWGMIDLSSNRKMLMWEPKNFTIDQKEHELV